MRISDWSSDVCSSDLLSPSLGGAVQRLNRLGDRHALKVSLPPMRSEPDGRIYASKLRRALQQGAIFSWPQDQFTVGTVGTPLVNGAGQTGSTLVLDGFAASYPVREGQFFSDRKSTRLNSSH